MKINNNGKIIRPGGVTWLIQRANSGDGPALKSYMEGQYGFSQFGITPPNMTDSAWTKVQKIGEYVYRKMYFTGINDLAYAQTDRALEVLPKIDINQALNSGKGPKHICGTVSGVMIGILATYGVVARYIKGKSTNGHLDTSLEIFVPEYQKWVFYIAFMNGYVLLPNGVPATSLEIKFYYTSDRSGEVTYKSGTATIQTDTGYDSYGLSYALGWTGILTVVPTEVELAARLAGGYFNSCAWLTYNALNILGGTRSGTAIFSHRYRRDMNSVTLDIAGTTAVTGMTVPIVATNDIFPTFNIIELIDIKPYGSGFLTATFEHCMIEFQKLQTSVDGSTWTDVYGLSVYIPQFGSGSFYIRGIDANGCPSNVVEIVY